VLIESDILIAYIKKRDWLKPIATRIIDAIESGKIRVQASSEVLHELYYVFSDFASIDIILANEARISSIRNLEFVEPDPAIYLTALSLMETYELTSIFDAIYAATTLSPKTTDNKIISSDGIYDKIKGIERVDPRELV